MITREPVGALKVSLSHSPASAPTLQMGKLRPRGQNCTRYYCISGRFPSRALDFERLVGAKAWAEQGLL